MPWERTNPPPLSKRKVVFQAGRSMFGSEGTYNYDFLDASLSRILQTKHMPVPPNNCFFNHPNSQVQKAVVGDPGLVQMERALVWNRTVEPSQPSLAEAEGDHLSGLQMDQGD